MVIRGRAWEKMVFDLSLALPRNRRAVPRAFQCLCELSWYWPRFLAAAIVEQKVWKGAKEVQVCRLLPAMLLLADGKRR